MQDCTDEKPDLRQIEIRVPSRETYVQIWLSPLCSDSTIIASISNLIKHAKKQEDNIE